MGGSGRDWRARRRMFVFLAVPKLAMPEFAYIARDATGQKIAGRLAAATRQEALAALASKALFPVSVDAAKSASMTFRGRRVSAQLVATTLGQLADLLRSGVPLIRSLTVLKNQCSHAGLAETLEQLRTDVEGGSGIADAMLRHPRVFNEMSVSIVRAGSEGGFLEDSLDQVADFTEKQEDLKSRTLGAIAYPAFLCTVGTLVIAGLIVFVVPNFAVLFDRLREQGELPALTDALLWLSDTVRSYGLFILAGVAGMLLVIRARFSTEEGKTTRDRLKLRIPVAGGIFLNLAVARFCRVLGTLLQNGVPILKSLEISSDAAGNRVLAEAVRKAAENISSGETLAEPLGACGYFPQSVVEMIGVAEESNSLEKVLTDIADGLERRTWRRLDLAVRLLEPVMLLVLAGVVLMVVIALLLPVMKMSMTMT